MGFRIETLYGGHVQPLGANGQTSAIAKAPLPPPWHLTTTGLTGDTQADPRHHGGPEKALHHYPLDHYPYWRAAMPEHAALLSAPPAFGENLSTVGLTEADVCIGDVWALGCARLQVSQGRQPCWKLNVRFSRADLARQVQSTGRTGWYYRVLEAGIIQPGDTLSLVDRPQPDWPLARAIALLYQRTDAFDDLASLAGLSELAPSWRDLANRRIATRRVEDWSRRLDGA